MPPPPPRPLPDRRFGAKGAGMTDADIHAAAQVSKAWPFEEARKLVKRFPGGKADSPVLFETGYGPSGLPHIGTFQEVLRTTLVRRAYEVLTGGAPTRLVAFSDDMDGLRKVPDNVPNQGLLTAHLGRPLTRIPDPFEKYESFAHHNNAMLREFLDRFGFDYEFVSASDRYNSGAFDEALKGVLRHYDAIQAIMLPTLREERRKTYSSVLPVSPRTGHVLQVPVEVVDAEAGSSASPTWTARWSSSRSSAARPSCNGRSTGRCAGSPWASTTRCAART